MNKRKCTSGASTTLLAAARELRSALGHLRFGAPVAFVYNPLVYAWGPYELYLRRYAASQKRVLFLGMNPGPFGMVQTGVPFGEIPSVRDWLRISALVGKPPREHPRRPVQGFDCPRCEVSGQRLWRLFASRFGTPENFFAEHLVVNYCPLAFLESTGRNRTPDKLPPRERARLFQACDAHLTEVTATLRPEWIIGIGDFAFQRAQALFPSGQPRVGRILHPSPASPAANRDWPGTATAQLEKQGVWEALLPRNGSL